MIELMLAMVVIAGGILMALMANTYALQTGAVLQEKMVATQDAHRTIEMLRAATATGNFPENVTGTYADGTAVDGFTNLTYEAVTVTYADTEADPLDVTVTSSWVGQDQRNKSVQLRTLITQRE